MVAVEQAIQDLIHAAAVLAADGGLTATDGNLSARVADDRVVITRGGIEKRSLSPEDFLTIHVGDEAVPGVSSEWKVHRAIYRARPEVHSVLHAHSRYLTAFAVAGRTPRIELLAETALTVGEIAAVEYRKPGSMAIAEAVVRSSSVAGVYLLANHGAVAVGDTVACALHRLERAELLARVELLSDLLGGGRPLTESQVHELLSPAGSN